MPHREQTCDSPIFSELLCAVEAIALRFSPEYYGLNIPRGDGSAVVIVPGLLGIDLNLFELHAWLRRIGYRPYYSRIGCAADCPNRLSIRLDETIDRAFVETGRRVHIIGHSLGGVFARSAAVRKPGRVASVITLGTPYRGLAVHRMILGLSDILRNRIWNGGSGLSPKCATSRCSCTFGRSLGRKWPRSIRQTAVYTKCDGIVDWRYCLSGKSEIDVEVVGTHLGLPFNASVLSCVGSRLAASGGAQRQRS